VYWTARDRCVAMDESGNTESVVIIDESAVAMALRGKFGPTRLNERRSMRVGPARRAQPPSSVPLRGSHSPRRALRIVWGTFG
jgi:hypothetical protein